MNYAFVIQWSFQNNLKDCKRFEFEFIKIFQMAGCYQQLAI